jgi:hypothetical protein
LEALDAELVTRRASDALIADAVIALDAVEIAGWARLALSADALISRFAVINARFTACVTRIV